MNPEGKHLSRFIYCCSASLRLPYCSTNTPIISDPAATACPAVTSALPHFPQRPIAHIHLFPIPSLAHRCIHAGPFPPAQTVYAVLAVAFKPCFPFFAPPPPTLVRLLVFPCAVSAFTCVIVNKDEAFELLKGVSEPCTSVQRDSEL